MAIAIKFEMKHERQFIQKLNDFPAANKEATKNALNTAAALSRKNAVKNIRNDFTLRNKFTERNIQFDKVQSSSADEMMSVIGATQKVPYMKTQDEGGVKLKKGKSYALASRQARDGSDKNVINKMNYMQHIIRRGIRQGQPSKRGKAISRGRKGNAVAQMYIANKNNLVIVRGNKIFSVPHFEKRGRDHVIANTKLLYTLRRESINIKKTEWLKRAIYKPSQDLERIYISQIKKIWRKE